jgi:7,8-dihydropterin-6-yl-methyl-4-(beta-D-ribofuranosyl)aminobenzene 5'-phosphate synthase
MASRRSQSGGATEALVRIVILSTMLTDRRGLGEWGFSALVESGGHRLLFDAGGRPDTVLGNAEALGVDLASIPEIVLSHGHLDHTGGLVSLRRTLRERNPAALARAHVGRGFFVQRTRGGRPFSLPAAARAEYEALGGTFVEHGGPVELWPGAFLTGPVERRYAEGNPPKDIVALTAAGPAPDEVPEDISLVLDGPEGLVVLTGCGHAGVVNTLEAARAAVRAEARVSAVVGGLHLFDADDATLAWTGAALRRFGVGEVLGAHCTGIEAVFQLRASAGLDRRTCVVGAVGASYEVGKGIAPGTLAR